MAADKRTLKIHQPGDAPAPAVAETQLDIDDEIELGIGSDAPLSDEERIEAEVQRRLSMSLGRKSGEHPHQTEIDATKISRAQMSTDGWVCPAPPALDAAAEAFRKAMGR